MCFSGLKEATNQINLQIRPKIAGIQNLPKEINLRFMTDDGPPFTFGVIVCFLRAISDMSGDALTVDIFIFLSSLRSSYLLNSLLFLSICSPLLSVFSPLNFTLSDFALGKGLSDYYEKEIQKGGNAVTSACELSRCIVEVY